MDFLILVTTSIKLFVGLGNPGSEYTHTRHNAGAWFVQRLADQYRIPLTTEKKFSGAFGRGRIQNQEVLLLIPHTFMNLSGQSVAPLLQFYKMDSSQLLVAHDELDLNIGVARLKDGGGHGGHNGLRDIIEKTGLPNFARLRIGIGRPAHAGQVANFVLSRAPQTEQAQIDEAITRSLAIIPLLVEGQWSAAMKQLHTSTSSQQD